MNMAVLSGKSGTGKTTIANSLTELDKGLISITEMKIGNEGSGKLTNYLCENGRKFSSDERLIIIDGSTGIGCSVISSITESDAVLVVTEPTKSGLEDLMRIVALCERFGVFTMVCINKFNIDQDMSEELEKFIKKEDLVLVGKIPYDDIIAKSINDIKLIKYENSKAASAIKEMWQNIKAYIY